MKTVIKRGYVKTYDDSGKLVSKIPVAQNITQPEIKAPQWSLPLEDELSDVED